MQWMCTRIYMSLSFLLLVQQAALSPQSGYKHKKGATLTSNSFFCCGATRNRTGDTRIFSPLLYQLSYGTNTMLLNCGCKGTTII